MKNILHLFSFLVILSILSSACTRTMKGLNYNCKDFKYDINKENDEYNKEGKEKNI